MNLVFNKITTQQYRDIDAAHYSLLKAIEQSPVVKKVEGTSVALGSIVDCLLTSPEEFEDQFYVCDSGLTGQDLILADTIIKRALSNGVDYVYIKENAYTVISPLIKELGIYGNLKDPMKIQAKWDTPEFWNYIMAGFLSQRKTIIDSSLIAQAQACNNKVRSDTYTSYIFNNDDKYQRIYQLPIIFIYEDMKCKALLDVVLIDHLNKKVHPMDLKTTSDNVFSFANGGTVKKYNYILQAGFYLHALLMWMEEMGIADYEIDDWKWIVVQTNYDNPPVIVSTSFKNAYHKGSDGYIDKYGVTKKGWVELLEELKFYQNCGFYYSKEQVENDGVLTLKEL